MLPGLTRSQGLDLGPCLKATCSCRTLAGQRGLAERLLLGADLTAISMGPSPQLPLDRCRHGREMVVAWGEGCEGGQLGAGAKRGRQGGCGQAFLRCGDAGCMGPVWQGSPDPHAGIQGTWDSVPRSQSSMMSPLAPPRPPLAGNR